MVTLTLNTTGLILAGLIIFAGLMAPSVSNGDSEFFAIVWAIGTIIVAVITYLAIFGLTVMIG